MFQKKYKIERVKKWKKYLVTKQSDLMEEKRRKIEMKNKYLKIETLRCIRKNKYR